MTKTIRTDDLEAAGKRRYAPKNGSRAPKDYCRISIRHNADGANHLIVALTTAIAGQAGIKTGDRVGLYVDDKTMTLIPGANDISIRKQAGERTAYPYMLIPVGADKLFDCTITGITPVRIEHEVDKKGRLVLTLPAAVTISFADGK